MLRYLLGRFVGIIFVIFAVSVIIFLLMHSLPGGPFNEDKVPLSDEAKANYLRKYGLDKPLYEQYARYMGNALRGDLGIPFQSPNETVSELIGRTFVVSAQLGLVTLLFAIPIGLILGIIAAQNQNSWIDYTASALATFGITVPNFVVGVWLVLLLAIRWDILPTGGWGEWYHFIMPAIALGLPLMAVTARYTRTSLLEVSRADYVRTARAKGLSDRRVLTGHTMKNALIPLITVIGPQIPNVITGTIFVESIFRIPGLGKFFVTSIIARDYPMIMGTLLLVAVLWSVVYLITDLLYVAVDPRVRLDRGTT